MNFVKFTHANKKTPIYLTREHVWNIYYSDTHKATHIVSTAGAIVPVAEDVEQAMKLVFENNNKKDV